MKKERKSSKSEESVSKEHKTVNKKDKTTIHSHHTRNKYLEKYKNSKARRTTKNPHHHHHHRHQHHEKLTTGKSKLRSKRHSVQKSKCHSHSHTHFRSYLKKSLEDIRENSEGFQSVNADDNDNKTPEEVSNGDDYHQEEEAETNEEEIMDKLESKEIDNDKGLNNVETKQQGSERNLNKLQGVKSGSHEEFTKSIEQIGDNMSEKSKSNENKSSQSESPDDNVSDNKENDRKSLRRSKTRSHTHNKTKTKNIKSKKRNEKKDKSTVRKKRENISFDKHNDQKNIERIEDFKRENNTRFIISEKLLNHSRNAFLVIGDNITIYNAGSLYKPLTGNMSINGSISDKVYVNGTTQNSITINITTNKNIKNDLKSNDNFTKSSEKIKKSINEIEMKAHDNETYIISESTIERNDKSGKEDQSTENSERGINADRSVTDRSSAKLKTSDHSNDKANNPIDENTNMKMISKSDTTDIPLNYFESLDIEQKFHTDVREKLTELNLTAENIDQFNETLIDMAELNQLIDAISVINDGRQKKEKIGIPNFSVKKEKDTREVKTQPNARIVDQRPNFERDVKLAEFIQDSIDLYRMKIGRNSFNTGRFTTQLSLDGRTRHVVVVGNE